MLFHRLVLHNHHSRECHHSNRLYRHHQHQADKSLEHAYSCQCDYLLRLHQNLLFYYHRCHLPRYYSSLSEQDWIYKNNYQYPRKYHQCQYHCLDRFDNRHKHLLFHQHRHPPDYGWQFQDSCRYKYILRHCQCRFLDHLGSCRMHHQWYRCQHPPD